MQSYNPEAGHRMLLVRAHLSEADTKIFDKVWRNTSEMELKIKVKQEVIERRMLLAKMMIQKKLSHKLNGGNGNVNGGYGNMNLNGGNMENGGHFFNQKISNQETAEETAKYRMRWIKEAKKKMTARELRKEAERKDALRKVIEANSFLFRGNKIGRMII